MSRLPGPLNKTVTRVVEHLESIGLHVYGSAMTDGKLDNYGLMDYSAEEIKQYRKLHHEGKLDEQP